mmetsp:Transcript_9197/g.16580  ORF Transcript_9197/g.16580 Transcript_9197/m.16580 type:complete len:126 (-) Transcript_9197:96-473(-)
MMRLVAAVPPRARLPVAILLFVLAWAGCFGLGKEVGKGTIVQASPQLQEVRVLQARVKQAEARAKQAEATVKQLEKQNRVSAREERVKHFVADVKDALFSIEAGLYGLIGAVLLVGFGPMRVVRA